MEKCCIYKIQHKTNGKFYIGRTNNSRTRKNKHFGLLRRNKHHCNHLQYAWNLYGEEEFEYIVIEKNLTIEKAVEREQFYLDYFKNKLYNVSFHADCSFGESYRKGKKFEEIFDEEKAKKLKKVLSENASKRKGDKNPFYGKVHTEEYKKNASERMKAKNYKPKNSRPVMIDGKEYESATAASRELGVVAATILHRITSNNPKYASYHYVGESVYEQPKVNTKIIIVDEVEYNSLKEAALALGIHQSTMSQRLRSKKPEHVGYRYKEEVVTI